jgi:acetyl-CoA acetyltransferase
LGAEVFLVDGVRAAQGRYGGALAGVRPDDLAAITVGEAVSRSGVPADAIDEMILGAANQAGEDNRDVVRMAVLLAGFPDTVPGCTVNRLCASGLTAVVSAALAIQSGDADIVVAGGVESMTRAPWVMAKPGTPWARPGEVFDTSLGWRFTNPRFAAMNADVPAGSRPEVSNMTLSMGETAEEVAALGGWTCDWPSPSTCTPPSGNASAPRSYCATKSPVANWAAKPARVFTLGLNNPTDEEQS